MKGTGSGRSIRGRFRRLWRDEEAQSTFEYILMLAIAVMLAVFVVKVLIRPTMTFLSNKVGEIIRTTFFTPRNMHRLRLK